MTPSSIREYTEAVQGRYLRVLKKEKGRILDKFTHVTGYHRKAAIRLLCRGNDEFLLDDVGVLGVMVLLAAAWRTPPLYHYQARELA